MAKRKQNITPEQLDRLIALRLAGVSVRKTAVEVGVWPSTVQARWTEYLASIAEERAEMVELERTEAVARFERAAADAWQAWEKSVAAGKADVRFLAEYRQALAQAAKLSGLEVQKVEHSGSAQFIELLDSEIDRLRRQLEEQDRDGGHT
jgi:hypothetical protein